MGTIVEPRARRAFETVHPHGRGDNFVSESPATAWNGSPPRAWGQCSLACDDARRDRFTPTGVGTMAKVTTWTTAAPVHPHGRGDNVRARVCSPRPTGSPPRAWGQSPRTRRAARLRRFTPTGVGTMDVLRDALQHAAGSPPRAWGQSRRSGGGRRQHLVHPHGRGDNTLKRGNQVSEHGSPPRAWGQYPAIRR